jgi:hypothetical protein
LSESGIEEISKKTISSNYDSQRYFVDILEKNPDKKSRLVAHGVRAFYYIEKPELLTQDIQSKINEKVKKYFKKNLFFKRLLVYIPNEADYLIRSTEIFREGCGAINNTWKDVFEEAYCVVSMYDIECGDHASKLDEYVVYDFQNKKAYILDNKKKMLSIVGWVEQEPTNYFTIITCKRKSTLCYEATVAPIKEAFSACCQEHSLRSCICLTSRSYLLAR